MAQTTTPVRRVKSKAKKERFVRVLRRIKSSGELIVRIQEGGPRCCKASLYLVSPVPADFGRAFRFEKFAIDGSNDFAVYFVNIGDASTPASCECKGYLQHGHKTTCKHVACVRKLIAEGKL